MSSARIVLIVEDEPLIAMMLEDFLEALGHEVRATAESLDDALKAVAEGGFDFAVLDVNLRGVSVWPVAEKLSQAGIPFVLASGGHVEKPPEKFRDRRMLEKPYTLESVAKAIDQTAAEA